MSDGTVTNTNQTQQAKPVETKVAQSTSQITPAPAQIAKPIQPLISLEEFLQQYSLPPVHIAYYKGNFGRPDKLPKEEWKIITGL